MHWSDDQRWFRKGGVNQWIVNNFATYGYWESIVVVSWRMCSLCMYKLRCLMGVFCKDFRMSEGDGYLIYEGSSVG